MSAVIKGWETLVSAFETFPAMTEHTCAFTGHRPNKLPWKDNENDIACVMLKNKLYNLVLELVNKGFVNFLSGMALGTDIWAADAVLEIQQYNPTVKLHCIIPYCGQADTWKDTDRHHYQDVLSRADTIIRVQRDYTKDCLSKRNQFLVNAASVILAVYDGRYRSGTAATVRYAQKLGKKLMILNPVSLLLTYEDTNSEKTIKQRQ